MFARDCGNGTPRTLGAVGHGRPEASMVVPRLARRNGSAANEHSSPSGRLVDEAARAGLGSAVCHSQPALDHCCPKLFAQHAFTLAFRSTVVAGSTPPRGHFGCSRSWCRRRVAPLLGAVTCRHRKVGIGDNEVLPKSTATEGCATGERREAALAARGEAKRTGLGNALLCFPSTLHLVSAIGLTRSQVAVAVTVPPSDKE